MKVAPLIAVALILCIAFLRPIQAKKKKFCIGKDGNHYEVGDGYDDNEGKVCVRYKCVKKKKKLVMKKGKCVSLAVDGVWSDWSGWSACTSTCGAATKTRKRTCSSPPPSDDGSPCPGLKEQIEECSLPSCSSSEENVNVTALELNVQSLNDSVQTLQSTMQSILELMITMQSTTNKQGTCLSDLSSSDCPASAAGKVGVVDGIAANTAGVSNNSAGLTSSKAGIATNKDTATKLESCLADVNSVNCPSSKGGKTSVPDAIMENADAIVTHHPAATWELGLNLNPCDGGDFGYGGPWSKGMDVGTKDQAFTKDFMDMSIWKKPSSFITIARHVDGQCTMSKTWELLDKTRSMHSYFSTYPGRIYATGDGSRSDNNISSDIPESADGLTGSWRDPIFGTEGGLVFNWYYANNGVRIGIPGGYKNPYSLPAANENNDDFHGLGNEFGADTKNGTGSTKWRHDVAKIGPDCFGVSCPVVGTDHGSLISSGACWGSYAVFLSRNVRSFSCQGRTLSTVESVRVCSNDVEISEDCLCPSTVCGVNSTCVNGTTCTPACTNDVRISSTCMCSSVVCGVNSTCDGGTTCTPEPTIIEAINEVRKTMNDILYNVTELRNTTQNLSNVERNMIKMKARKDQAPNNENKVLELVTNLTNYLNKFCLINDDICSVSKILTFRNQIKEIWDQIYQTKNISSTFLEDFKNKTKEFELTASKAITHNTVCERNDGRSFSILLLLVHRIKEKRTINLKECPDPPVKENGVWQCDKNHKFCFLICNPDFETRVTRTICFGGIWRLVNIMECLQTESPSKRGPAIFRGFRSITTTRTGITSTAIRTSTTTLPSTTTTPGPTTLICKNEKYVDEPCRCGTEEDEDCPKGSKCTGGNCEIECPYGYEKNNNIIPEEMVPLSKRTTGEQKDALEFGMVPIDSNGDMATVKEVKDNIEMVSALLNKCDIAQIHNGSVEGSGYEDNKARVVNNTCQSCKYKIIKKEKPPSEKFNQNVADLCCFIIRGSTNETKGSKQTFILTNHTLLDYFPDTCNSSCMYTLYEDLERNALNPQYCQNQIINSTCCSDETGSFCRHYGDGIYNGTQNNIKPNETCSSVCTEIANCSSNLNDTWCQKESFDSSNSTSSSSTTAPVSSSTTATASPSTTTPSLTSSLISLFVPSQCVPIISPPVVQTAQFYPKSLPEIDPFNLNRTVLIRASSHRVCNFWTLWKFSCNHAYNYRTYHHRKHYYRLEDAGGESFNDYYFKHGCCAQFHILCKYKKRECPRNH